MSSVDLAERLAATSLIPAGSSILVGLSGGVDSVVLLHLLCRLAPRLSWKISALHVHHGISLHADSWADFCTVLCARLNIPLNVERVDITPLRTQGLEAAARSLRHQAFAKQYCDLVALAHHADDQVETLFLQLLRGAGVKGASAMPVLSLSKEPVLSPSKALPAASQKLWRPLLQTSRQEILNYAASMGLDWIEDESNADEGYPRNFLRHKLLPLLGEKFPAYRHTLTRSAEHFAGANELLDDLARIDAAVAVADGTLKVAALQVLNLNRAKNLLRYFLYQHGAPMPQVVQLDDMLHQLCSARSDATVCVGFGDWQLRRYRGRAYALRALGEFDRKLVLSWQGEAELAWPALNSRVVFHRAVGEGVSLAKLQGKPVTLRLRQGGEALRPHLHGSNRTLKNLLQENFIPPWQRDRLPLLHCGDELVCVPGVAISAAYQATEGEAGILLGSVANAIEPTYG